MCEEGWKDETTRLRYGAGSDVRLHRHVLAARAQPGHALEEGTHQLSLTISRTTHQTRLLTLLILF